jgi:hypothetical protein
MRTCWQTFEVHGTLLYQEMIRDVESDGGAVCHRVECQSNLEDCGRAPRRTVQKPQWVRVHKSHGHHVWLRSVA